MVRYRCKVNTLVLKIMKNVFLSDICQRIIFKTGSAAEIKSVISHELEDPIWERVLQVREYPKFLADPFVVAIANKDADNFEDLLSSLSSFSVLNFFCFLFFNFFNLFFKRSFYKEINKQGKSRREE